MEIINGDTDMTESDEHCLLVGLDSHVPSKASSHEYTFTLAFKKPRPIPKTWVWAGNDNGPSFLDLPRELRDMIYVYVCDGLRHDGSGWRKTGEYARDCIMPAPRIVFQNCNIMSTCRQVHWEFAEILYARPLQLTGVTSVTQSHIVVPASHIIPLSVTYVHLVEKLAFIHSTDRRNFCELNYFREERCLTPEDHWRDMVTAAMQLLKLFPAVQVLRVLHQLKPLHYPDPAWDSMLGACDAPREKQVETAERFLKAVRLSDSRKIRIPFQLELLHLDGGIPNEKPWGQALKNVQAAELHKKGLGGKPRG